MPKGTVMNERIKELALECGAWNQVYGDQNFMIDENFDIEKFADSIVADCYQKLIDMDQQVKGSHNYYKHAAIQIRLHFGIEP